VNKYTTYKASILLASSIVDLTTGFDTVLLASNGISHRSTDRQTHSSYNRHETTKTNADREASHRGNQALGGQRGNT